MNEEQLELFPDPSSKLLREAEGLICGPREGSYGRANDAFTQVSELWTGYMKNRHPAITFTSQDVCVMMALLKVARLAVSPDHRDSLVDGIGYLALVGRCND